MHVSLLFHILIPIQLIWSDCIATHSEREKEKAVNVDAGKKRRNKSKAFRPNSLFDSSAPDLLRLMMEPNTRLHHLTVKCQHTKKKGFTENLTIGKISLKAMVLNTIFYS